MKPFFSLSECLRQADPVIESLLYWEISTGLGTLLLNLDDRFGEHHRPA